MHEDAMLIQLNSLGTWLSHFLQESNEKQDSRNYGNTDTKQKVQNTYNSYLYSHDKFIVIQNWNYI